MPQFIRWYKIRATFGCINWLVYSSCIASLSINPPSHIIYCLSFSSMARFNACWLLPGKAVYQGNRYCLEEKIFVYRRDWLRLSLYGNQVFKFLRGYA